MEEIMNKIYSFPKDTSELDIITDNLLITVEMISRSALLREESRGIHYREDFPNSDTAFAKPSVIGKGKDGEMEAFLGEIQGDPDT